MKKLPELVVAALVMAVLTLGGAGSMIEVLEQARRIASTQQVSEHDAAVLVEQAEAVITERVRGERLIMEEILAADAAAMDR